MFTGKIKFYFRCLLSNATEIDLHPVPGHGLFQRVIVFLFGDQFIYSGITCECNGAVLVLGCDILLCKRKMRMNRKAKKKCRLHQQDGQVFFHVSKVKQKVLTLCGMFAGCHSPPKTASPLGETVLVLFLPFGKVRMGFFIFSLSILHPPFHNLLLPEPSSSSHGRCRPILFRWFVRCDLQ